MAIRRATGGPLVAITLFICVAAVPVGCGGGASSSAANPAETRFVALFNTICREADYPGNGPSRQARRRTELAELRALTISARKAPRMARYISDLAARRRLRPRAGSYIDKVYRADVKVYADEKALGLTSCLGRPPRKLIGG